MLPDFYDFFYPVFGGIFDKGEFVPKNLYGTATNIGRGFFITAGHTLTNALENPAITLGMGFPGFRRSIFYENIHDHEIFPALDIGIFQIESFYQTFNAFKICTDDLKMLDDICTGGFPHGLDLHHQTLQHRAFKGYIVNHMPFYEFPKKPDVYELSFQCPKGISGAPILKKYYEIDALVSHGYIIGNANTEITVFTEKEKTSDGTKESIYEKTESVKFGIAINAREFESVSSNLVGNLYKHFISNDLIYTKSQHITNSNLH